MDKSANPDAPVNGGVVPRLVHWIDVRTGVKSLTRKALDEPIPGGARFAYVFGSGLLFIFVLQVITGVSLALYYTPTAETAHTSVAYITKQVAGGAFLRSLHSYGSGAMIIVLALHFLQTFFFGAFKGRRELLWISGALLSFLVLGMGFTGYLLPWDQKAYFATAVGTNVAGEMPLIGNMLTRFLRGGNSIGTLTLSRFYVAHVFLIPAAIFSFIGAHILLFRKAGPAGPVKEDPISPKLATEPFYPRQVLFDMAFVLLIIAVLAGLSYLRPATLGPVADPSDTHFLPRPEWYYLPMFEWLKFWEGPKVVLGVVVLPGLLAIAFFLMPFIDRSLERKPWRRPIPALAVAIVVLGMVFLGVKSHVDDKHGQVAAQLALQQQQEETYSAAPFEPYVESSDSVIATSTAASTDPLVAEGKAVFAERGCSGCHGATATGTPAAPTLVGVTRKFQQEQLIALLRNPSARMKAGRMPSVDASASDMSALLEYLGALGSRAANVPAMRRNPLSAEPGQRITAGASPLARISEKTTHGAWTKPDLSASLDAGKRLFQQRGCFACHGNDGAGGLAPALAPLISRITDAQLAQLLESPSAKMKDGGMQPVSEKPDRQSLISYLRTLKMPKSESRPISDSASKKDAPAPGPTLNASSFDKSRGATTAVKASGKLLFRSQGCVACHGFDARGTQLAPSLIDVARKFPGEKLSELLHNPTTKMQTGGMPAVTLSDSQMAALLLYLSSLRTQPAPSQSLNAPIGEPVARVIPGGALASGSKELNH